MTELRDLMEKTERFLQTPEYVLSIGDVDRRITKEEAEKLLEAARDFVRQVKSYLDQWMKQEGGT